MKLFRRLLIGLVAVVVIAYGGVLAYVFLNQRSLQYDVAGKFLDLGETMLTNAEVVEIPTSNNERIRGWYAPPQAGKPVIVFYKGNARSFTADSERYEQWVADGFGFLAFDYRGFPASPGVLNQENVLKDSIAAYAFAQTKGVPLVIWGRSLGSGPASYVASQRDADALLLETPFDSALSVGQARYPYLPVQWLMSDQYPVDQWILDVTEPVFVAVAGADTTIPPVHGERTYELAPNKVELWVEPGAEHSDLWERGIWTRARPFFETAVAAAQ